MKTQDKPQMIVLHSGVSVKVFEVKGNSGMTMPEHISTEEAVVIVQKGSAILKIFGKEHFLKKDDSYVIPAGEKHTLTLKEDFQSCVVMGIKSEIQFVNK